MKPAFPTAHHAEALEHLLNLYRADSMVRGALLCGSLARGTARTDSDVDILVVLEEDPDGYTRRTRYGAVDVEETRRTYQRWVEQFSPSRVGDESWGYAFLDGSPLYDPDGVVERLVAVARESHATYRTPDHIRSYYRWLWGHVRPKVEFVLRNGDAVEMGWAAAVTTGQVTDTLWAVNHRPLPSRDLGTFQRHLGELILPAGAAELVREMLQASPRDALRIQLQLIEMCLPYLRV